MVGTSIISTTLVLAPKLFDLILDCRMLLDLEWTILLRYFFHEANGVTNELAKKGQEHQCSIKEYNKCLNFVYIKYVCAILKLGTPHGYPVYNTCNGAA